MQNRKYKQGDKRIKEVELLGIKYASFAEAARTHGMNNTTLRNRLKHHGPNWPHLFDHNIYKYRGVNGRKPIIYDGHKFQSIMEMSKFYNMDYKLLSHRIKKYGINSAKVIMPKKELKKITSGHGFTVTILGKEYASINAAAEEHDISGDTLKQRIRKHGLNWPYLFDKHSLSKKSVKLNGIYYNSLTEAAAKNHIGYKTLKARIKKYGYDSNELFKKKSQITLLGKEYPSILAAAKEHKITVYTLRRRIRKHGTDWPYLFDKQVTTRYSIKLCGISYRSISEAAIKNNINKATLEARILRYGRDSKKLFGPNERSIILLGHRYDSISEAAKQHNINVGTLTRRIKNYGKDWPQLFEKPTVSNRQKQLNRLGFKNYNDAKKSFNIDIATIKRRLDANLPITVNKQDYIKHRDTRIVHENNLLTLQDVSEQTGIKVNTLYKLLIGKRKSNKLPLDLVKYKRHVSSETIGFEPEIVDKIRSYYQSLPKDLIILPQSNNQYLISKTSLEVYSNKLNNGFIYPLKRVNTEAGDDYYNLVICPKKRAQKYTIKELESLINFPKITASDITTFAQLKNSFNKKEYSRINYILHRDYHTWKRHNSDGKLVYGFLTNQVRKVVEEILPSN